MFSLGLRCQARLPLSKFALPTRLTPVARGFHISPLRRLPRLVQQETSPEVPLFKNALKRSKPAEAFSDKVGKPGIRNQVLFVALGSIFAFSYAASRTNIDTEYWIRRLKVVSSLWLIQPMSSTDLKKTRNVELITELRGWFSQLNTALQNTPALFRNYVQLAFVSVVQPYADATEGKRLCWKICLLNAGVYLAWKIKALQPAMAVRFMHNPLSGLSYTLLTSMFSHKSFIHLLLNCLALEGFGSAAYFYIMKEQTNAEPAMLESTAAYHFLAFFVSAGLFSGLVSHVATTKILYPRMIKQLSLSTRKAIKPETWAGAVAASAAPAAASAAKQTVPSILPSLGASGAIYAALTTTALAFPESQVALFIPPSYPIDIGYAVTGLVLLDTVGILRGWRVFDHWAHLGGAGFGVLYYTYGPSFWVRMRRTFSIEEEPSVTPTE